MLLRICICLVLGYLLGNLNGAIIISRWFHREDVRKKGSGNAGLTNFFRNYGGLDSLLVVVFDAGKTVLACFVGRWIFRAYLPEFVQTASMICGSAAVIGHVFPIIFGLRGGKGILSCAALAAYIDWKIFLVCLAVFAALVLATRYVSLGSVAAAVLYPFMYWLFVPENWAMHIMATAIALLAIFMHRTNIVRLIKGTESKLELHKKPE